jgi:hypothetical protein
MANIAREGNEIVLGLSAGERILAMHRDVRVPLSAVKSVDVVDGPIRRVQGLKPRNSKVLGGYWPGRFAYGSFFAMHCPRAEVETAVLLLEPRSVINTGDAGGEFTADVETLS